MKPRSHTLFHFTKNIDVLKSILKNGFWPRYSLEDFNWYNSSIGLISYPMVCFCDIPLARLDEHIGFYGEFGIGVTREWATSNKLNPLIYLSPSTPISSALSKVLGHNANANANVPNGFYPGSVSDINTIIAHVKPISGFVNVGGVLTNKEFYQENEWRYVPTSPSVKQWISKEDHLNPATLQVNNEAAKNYGSIEITPRDIKYIFVRSDADIPIVVDYIQTELGHFTANDLKTLVSRVVSTESISLDL